MRSLRVRSGNQPEEGGAQVEAAALASRGVGGGERGPGRGLTAGASRSGQGVVVGDQAEASWPEPVGWGEPVGVWGDQAGAVLRQNFFFGKPQRRSPFWASNGL